mmetsp:Transcript_31113/g.51387  ORF Transcript_31113/g.51387 Transcript_31113/m.51387 type:complete len:183 (-) Transcript_31113:28-576(-)
MNRVLSCVLLAALLQSSLAFSVRPAVVSSRRGVSVARFLASDDNNDEAKPAAPPVTTVPPPKPPRVLDPLVASVTRVDPSAPGKKMVNVPLLGEIDVEGSLVVLIPAAVIAVVGFIMSFVVAFNARDTLVDQLTQISTGINEAALAKTNQVPVDPTGCRGLCSSQDQQLESMRSFMEGISKK